MKALCDGLCTQGRQCPGQPVKPIRSVEQEHPWLRWLYFAAFVLAFTWSAAAAGCGGSDEPVAPDVTTAPPNCAAPSTACL